MATRLTQAAASAKQLGIVIAVIIPILILGRVAWGAISELTKPKPTPTPVFTSPKYNILPAISVTSDAVKSNTVDFALNTSNLQVPTPSYTLPTVQVFKYKKRSTTFDYINNINTIAQIFSIPATQSSQMSPTMFRFTSSGNDGAQIEIDIQYYSIDYKYNNPTAFIPIERGATIDEGAAVAAATAIRTAVAPYLGINTQPAPPTTPRPDKPYDVSYAYRNLDGTIQKVANKASANITEVKLNRDPYKGIPFVGSSTVNTNMKITYTEERATVSSSGANRPRTIAAILKHFPIDEASATDNAIYPIQPITSAFEDLKSGKGYIVSPTTPGTTYLILRAYLAYYEPVQYSEYVIPVWVFEGDTVNDPNFLFRAIVPAIATGWIQTQ